MKFEACQFKIEVYMTFIITPHTRALTYFSEQISDNGGPHILSIHWDQDGFSFNVEHVT